MLKTAETVLGKYQIRKTSKQRSDFREYLKGFAEERGYNYKTEKGYLGAQNAVIGDPDTAKVVYTAHYDTPSRLPFPNFITPKKVLIYILYNILICIGFIALSFACIFLAKFISGYVSSFAGIEKAAAYSLSKVLANALWIVLILIIFAGPANKHTANDNTSGVVTLLEIMDKLPDELKNDVAFVFFDLEEMGLLGSKGFASKHKSIKNDKFVVNFDCVSDGENILIATQKDSEKYLPYLEKAFVSNDSLKVDIRAKGVYYPSDQRAFKGGVAVAALKYSKFLKTEYMDKIHTRKDVVFCEANIEFLRDCAISLVREL